MLVRIEQKPRVIVPFSELIAALTEMSPGYRVRRTHPTSAIPSKCIHQG